MAAADAGNATATAIEDTVIRATNDLNRLATAHRAGVK